MAAIFRRPRLTLSVIVTLALVATACSLVKPVETPADKQQDAAQLAASGKHAEAAQAYADLATDSPADRDNYALLSAEQWVAAGNVNQAKQAYATVSGAARTKLPTSRALVAAEIALADNDPARALKELASIPVPTAPDLAQNYRYLQRASESLLAHPAKGAPSQLAVATEFPDQIALLLPLSGRAEAIGVSVRDGFIAAYLEQAAGARPRLKIYDVAAEKVAAAYQRAVQDGASFVVGPLTKEDVAAIAPLSSGGVPVLALNFLGDTTTAAANFYQFALLPEDEARIVARRLVADGKLSGVAILPDGELGTRVGAAFADELSHLGGTVLDAGRYQPGRPDFTDVIRQTLQVRGAKGEPATHRMDASFVFLSASPAAARLIVSQLKFHYAGDIPVYSTSDSFEPDPSANNDLDGLTFPDMPWMVSSDAMTGQIRDDVRNAWPARTARRDRLYAFGVDAYRLVPALKAKSLSQSTEIAGVTGKLRLDDHNRIRRELDWAQVRDGVAAPL